MRSLGILIIMALSAPAFADVEVPLPASTTVDDTGDYASYTAGCGYCGTGPYSRVPRELENIARRLVKSFDSSSREELVRQRWAKTLCSNHPCEVWVPVHSGAKDEANDNFISENDAIFIYKAKDISEEAAKEFLDIYFSEQEKVRSSRLVWTGIGIGILGTIIAGLALCQTIVSDRRVRAANERSVRNEVEIKNFKDHAMYANLPGVTK